MCSGCVDRMRSYNPLLDPISSQLKGEKKPLKYMRKGHKEN